MRSSRICRWLAVALLVVVTLLSVDGPRCPALGSELADGSEPLSGIQFALGNEFPPNIEFGPGRFLVIRGCDTPPTIDGRLDDVCWQHAKAATGFRLLDREAAAPEQTTAYVAYDDDRLYIGFACEEPCLAGIVAVETEHDAQVCQDDCVELFLDINRDYMNYFHLIVNSRGVTSDASVELVDDFIDLYYDWEPEYQVAASVGEAAWYVELAIPFAALKTGVARPSVYPERKAGERSALSLLEAPIVTAGSVWNINLARRRPSGAGESTATGESSAPNRPSSLSSWSPVCDKFYSPHEFGHLVFAEDLSRTALSALTLDVGAAHTRVVMQKVRIEEGRLRSLLTDLDKYVPGCRWVATCRRNTFVGYETDDGAIRIPNYARLDGQGRVALPEVLPPLSESVLNEILAKETPRFVFDEASLAELRERIEQDASVGSRWLDLRVEADELLTEPVSGFVPCEMQSDRNCVSREQAIAAGAGYGALGGIRSRCLLAYAVTRDTAYARQAWRAQSCLIDHFDKYQVFRSASNWYSIWDSSYEVYSSTYLYDMLAASGVMERADKIRLVEFIRRLGYRVDYCVKYSDMIGNHQYMWTGNFGCMALYFPEFPEHARWVGDVEDRMPRLYMDILADGGQIERSPGHHTYGLGFLCRYVTATKRLTGRDTFRKEYDGRTLEMALDWMAKIATPLGELPAVNDSKRPRLETHEFMLDIVNEFDRGDYLRAGKVNLSALPLEHLISERVAAKDPAWKSVLLPETGLAVMRDSWAEDSRYLLFDYGPHGAWHGHYDKMNIIMYADGVGWVLDAGASPHYCVYIEEHQQWHKQTVAHNTVLVDNASQAAVAGTLRVWETQAAFDLVSASHDGYAGITHTRTVFHPRDEYFIISDQLRCSDSREHEYSWLLHVYGEPGSPSHSSISFTKGDQGLLILPAAPNEIDSLGLAEGLCIDTIGERRVPLRDDGTWTPGDPGWAYIPYISLNSKSAADEVGYLVVLFPYSRHTEVPQGGMPREAPSSIECRHLSDAGGAGVGMRLRHAGYEDIYGEKKPTADVSREMELAGFRTDADYFFVRLIDDEIERAIRVGGTHLSRNGRRIATETY
jgi:hypothetical protein